MSEKTNEIDKGWNGAYSNWDIPKAVDSNTLISSKASNDQVTVLLSRDMYLIDQIETVNSTLTKSVDSLGNRVTAVEKSSADVASNFNELYSDVRTLKTEVSELSTTLSDEEIDKIFDEVMSEK